MNILVTGSNGFIGSHVSCYLENHGNIVIGLGRSEDPKTKCYEYLKCDLADDEVENIPNVLEDCGIRSLDAVVHLAADMRKEPYTVEVVENNCGGTQRLLELCESYDVPCFIQLSSLPVIGKPIEHPITENHPIMPPTVYHVTKHTQELLAEYATNHFGLKTISYRISSPVGSGVNPNTIFPVFVEKSLKNEDLELYGKGTRKQSYIHVDDISQAILKGINADVSGVYNLSSYNLISNKDLAETCIEVLDSRSKIRFNGKDDPMDDYVWDVSLDKITSEVGYVPERDIKFCISDLASSMDN